MTGFKRNKLRLTLAAAVGLSALAGAARNARADDNLFPPSDAAKASIDFDGRGFIVHGKHTFIQSGGMEYARIPRELWHDRLMKLKRAGFNCVEIYVFWNFHEPVKGKIDFTGQKDVGAFLQAAQDVGLYAIVRVGPYVCAEWDGGGFPVWLRFVPGSSVREDNAPYLAAVDAFFDKLYPIVVAHQITRGGNVVMVQLENEHRAGGGAVVPNAYFKHLLDQARAAGIEVPHFFSGLHHGGNPAGKPWSAAGRKSPWFSTETWIAWFSKYGGGTADDARKYARVMWDEVAHGGGGFNIYMFHGGSNFDFWNDDEDASSYDYGAMLGQDGDCRPLYYFAKRIGLLTSGLPELFSDSRNVDADYKDFAAGVTVAARKSDRGTVVFLQGDAAQPSTATLKDGTVIPLERAETAPVLLDTTLAPGIKVVTSAVRTLAVATNGNTTTWVVYAPAGQKARAELSFEQPPAAPQAHEGIEADAKDPKRLTVQAEAKEDAPWQYVVASGGQTLRLLVETPSWADRTWVTGEAGKQDVVVGPDYLDDYTDTGGKISMTVARPLDKPAAGEVLVFGAAEEPTRLKSEGEATPETAAAPKLGAWEQSPLDAPLAADYDDSKWTAGDAPPEMGVDGDISSYAWYRASFDSPAAGKPTLHFGNVGDDATVYVNGKVAGTVHHASAPKGKVPPPVVLPVDVAAGRNTLTVFVSHHGRNKVYGYIGPLGAGDPKGLIGGVTLESDGKSVPVTGWRLRGGVGEPDAEGLKWRPVDGDQPAGGNVTGGGVPAFYRTTFQAARPKAVGVYPVYRVTYAGMSSGSVYLNGHNLGRYPERIKGLDTVYLPECWMNDGANTLAFFDEAGHVPTGVTLVTDTAATHETTRIGDVAP